MNIFLILSIIKLRGSTEVKEHLWFRGYDWKNLYLGKLKAPFFPKKGDNFDSRYCNAPEKMDPETEDRYRVIKGSQIFKDAFAEFYYFNRYSNKNNNENESGPLSNLVFKNPHLEYLKEEEIVYDRQPNFDKRSNNSNKIRENNIIGMNSIFGIGDEQYSFMKKLTNSRSTATLLKGYNKRSLSSAFQ